ncbi:cytochrome P450 [Ilyonectria sp. MPI-CAGE-AT-0026]|nr:cytochrome P450 [Ilyonectria sp. MPI-CAGE-AT-0026]
MPGYDLGYVAGTANQPLPVQCPRAAFIRLLAHGLCFIHWTDDRNAMRALFGHFVTLFTLVPLEIVERGPIWASITKVYGLYANRDGKTHEEYDRLLREYGHFVRMETMTEVHGLQSKCSKGNFCATMEYGHSRVLNLDSIIDKAEHRARRQVWDRAFNKKGVFHGSSETIEAREQPIRSVIQQWLAKVDELSSRPINWTLFASLISFHITGHVGFSVDFGGDREVKEDIIHYFIEDFKSDKPKAFFTHEHLESDAGAFLIGAADSSFSPITFLFRHLILSPVTLDTLCAEPAPLFNCSQKDGFTNADLTRSAPFLNAVINEIMRLYNPACTAPGHTGIAGNEMADQLAKKGAQADPPTHQPPTRSFVKRQLDGDPKLIGNKSVVASDDIPEGPLTQPPSPKGSEEEDLREGRGRAPNADKERTQTHQRSNPNFNINADIQPHSNSDYNTQGYQEGLEYGILPGLPSFPLCGDSKANTPDVDQYILKRRKTHKSIARVDSCSREVHRELFYLITASKPKTTSETSSSYNSIVRGDQEYSPPARNSVATEALSESRYTDDDSDHHTCKRRKLRRSSTRGKPRQRLHAASPSSRRPPSNDKQDEGDPRVPSATFQEWSLEDATLKRVFIGGQALFQIQFSWNSRMNDHSVADVGSRAGL